MQNSFIEEIQIRKLKLWELPQLLRFRKENDYKSDFDNYSPESLFYSFLKVLWHRDRLVTYIVHDGKEIIGYLSMAFGKHKEFKGNVYVINIAVKSDVRGKGIGTSLFAAAENHAKERGARRVEFEVFGRNVKALRLYERLGYKKEGVKHQAARSQDGYDDLIFMAKLLS